MADVETAVAHVETSPWRTVCALLSVSVSTIGVNLSQLMSSAINMGKRVSRSRGAGFLPLCYALIWGLDQIGPVGHGFSMQLGGLHSRGTRPTLRRVSWRVSSCLTFPDRKVRVMSAQIYIRRA